MTEEICFLPATELAALIRRRAVSPVEVVEAYLARISQRNPLINAYVTVIADQAQAAARVAERAVGSGAPLGPLHGVPIAIKDLADFKAGVRNTFGSRPLAQYVAQETTTYVERLEGAGAIVLGKTNVPEFGHKGVTDNLLVGPTSTPFAPGKNAGGSSGGSAAAVADGLAALAQGTDGGGSIRIPASFCGVYGFKASWGRVAVATRPNAFGWHTPFVHSGPLARTVDDAALMLSVMAGPHPRDPYSLPDDGMAYQLAPRRSVRGLRIAYCPRFGDFPVDRQVHDIVAAAVPAFLVVGAEVDEVTLDLRHAQCDLAALWCRQMGVLYANTVADFKQSGIDLLGEHRAAMTPEFVAMVEAVQDLSAVAYMRDDTVRTDVFDAVQDVFDTYDLLVTPTLAVPPFANASDGTTVGPTVINGQDVDPLIGWCLTYPLNFTGHPAASIPAGFTSDGLPVGMQVVGRRFADGVVLAASAAFERVRPWFPAYRGPASPAPRDLGGLGAQHKDRF
jgi:amidase/aspartyl-tRNA(Asn)/glutamyl-tRNA(Gln) amidotransferase subunit A